MADYPKGTVGALQIMGWIFSGLGALYLRRVKANSSNARELSVYQSVLIPLQP